jgi:hypothetical protein
LRYTKVSIPLWSFRHAGGDTIEYSVDTHPTGLELQARMNSQLLHSQVFSDPVELMKSAERGRGLLQSCGWTMIETLREA